MPETQNRLLRVFLCHASQDKAIVRDLYKRLNTQGWIDPWLDEKKLFPGQDWNLEIEKAVEAADAILVCLSHASVTKEGYIQRELRYVLDIAEFKPEATLFIIPVRLEDCEPPRRLRIWQYADFFSEEDRDSAFERLLVSLQQRANRLGIPIDKLMEKQIHSIPKNLDRKKKKLLGREKIAEKAPEQKAPRPNLQEKKSSHTINLISVGIVSVVMLVLAGLIFGSTIIYQKIFAPIEPSPAKDLFVVVPTYIVTSTQNPSISHAGNSAVNTMISESDGMTLLYIPAGEFTMGSDNGEDDEKPAHKVYLNEFWIDQTEVTNSMYAKCVKEKKCKLPISFKSNLRDRYYDNPDFDKHPVINVSWNDAKAYCEWAGRRLPTEAEWEKAARGGLEGKSYPWGDDLPVCRKGVENGANFNGGAGCDSGDTEPVKSFAPNGYGVHDLAGNVWEWVADWYSGTYYREAPYSNPFGVESGNFRVVRGGSWNYSSSYLRSAFRGRDSPAITASDIGIRCVMDVSS